MTDLTGQATAAAAPTPFPDSARVLYAKNPLIEVVCQLRFPPILRIDSEIPADFQETIRGALPLFSDADPSPFPDMPSEVSQLLKASLPTQLTRRTWKFQSEDSNWTVTLARDFLALATTQYINWGEFRAKLEHLLQALETAYRPSFFTRIGLRYQNLIVRSFLGLNDAPWSELLQPYIAAEYHLPSLAPAVQETTHRILVELPYNQARVNLRYGTARREGEDESLILIDNDFFTEQKTELPNALNLLDLFNRESGRVFRWCITERLHEAMGPETRAR